MFRLIRNSEMNVLFIILCSSQDGSVRSVVTRLHMLAERTEIVLLN